MGDQRADDIIGHQTSLGQILIKLNDYDIMLESEFKSNISL